MEFDPWRSHIATVTGGYQSTDDATCILLGKASLYGGEGK